MKEGYPANRGVIFIFFGGGGIEWGNTTGTLPLAINQNYSCMNLRYTELNNAKMGAIGFGWVKCAVRLKSKL